MIGLTWNLPGSLDYAPDTVLDVELTVENLLDTSLEFCLVCGLFDPSSGSLVIDPVTSRIAYCGLVISDNEFTLDPYEVTIIELGPEETRTLSGSIQSPLTGVLLGIVALNKEQTGQLNALYTMLSAPPQVSLFEAMVPMISAVMVGVLIGVVVSGLAGGKE